MERAYTGKVPCSLIHIASQLIIQEPESGSAGRTTDRRGSKNDNQMNADIDNLSREIHICRCASKEGQDPEVICTLQGRGSVPCSKNMVRNHHKQHKMI